METTDNQYEVFDVVDLDDKVIGEATRGQTHNNKNLIHRSVGIAVFNRRGKIFLQRRSMTKDTDALLWTISCSGHVLKGENYQETAYRELTEELGIEGSVLNFLIKYIFYGEKETEMVTLYKINYDGEIALQTEEILEGKFFSKQEISSAIATSDIELNLWGKTALAKLGII